jgi:hypothetical protein
MKPKPKRVVAVCTLIFAVCTFGQSIKKDSILDSVPQAAQEVLPPEEPNEVPETKTTNAPSSISWYNSLDEPLDTTLAATMAALAIAVVSFLISFTHAEMGRINTILTNGGLLTEDDIHYAKTVKRGIEQIMLSFYFFLVFLVESLTLDEWEEPYGWLGQYDWANGLDLALASGAFAVGLVLLTLGVGTMKSMVDYKV